jgi:hypothetical protein
MGTCLSCHCPDRLMVTLEPSVAETDVKAGRLISERRRGSRTGEERKADVLVTS